MNGEIFSALMQIMPPADLYRGEIFGYIRDGAYIVAAALFIIGMKKLSSPKTARNGNRLAALAMLIVVVVTLVNLNVISWWGIGIGLAFGGVVGLILARYVRFTAMPQLVAVFNGFGGAASAIVASVELVRIYDEGATTTFTVVISIVVSTIIGAATLTGSLVAFGKLQALISTKPVLIPLRQIVTVLMIATALTLGILTIIYAGSGSINSTVLLLLGGVAIASVILGIILVLPIGGADMPVVVALLNSYSGLAAAGTGFAIGNNVLIVAGSLVGASGLILTRIMTRAMNRSLINVMAGGFGVQEGFTASGTSDGEKPVRAVTAEDAALALAYSKSVIFIPGYGLAVAQAQHAVREMADMLKERGISVRYAIHPVAGRMPGHMNVLLAEANVPYDELKDLEEINNDFTTADVAIVIGANDVTNPAARTDKASPIYGMPILNVDRAKSALVLKRSLASGFAGVENELFYKNKTMMLFGDAKTSLEELMSEIKAL